MDAGDNLIGRYGSGSGGWMRWDRSAGQLKLGYSNACSMAFDGSGACIVGTLQMPGASAAIAVGTTPPTASNAGTGIWIDRGGITGLASGAYQVKINATNGYIEAASGSTTISSCGIIVNGQGKITVRGGQAGGYPRMSLDYMEDSNATQVVYSSDSSASDCSMVMADGGIDFFGDGFVFYTGTVQITKGLAITSEPNPSASGYDLLVEGDLQKYVSGTIYGGGIFIPLSAPLTSACYDGDSFSTHAKTSVSLVTAFGAPENIKAALMSVAIRDANSASSTTAGYIYLAPNATADSGIVFSAQGLRDDAYSRMTAVVPCTGNSIIYRQSVASVASGIDLVIQIWGYWL